MQIYKTPEEEQAEAPVCAELYGAAVAFEQASERYLISVGISTPMEQRLELLKESDESRTRLRRAFRRFETEHKAGSNQ